MLQKTTNTMRETVESWLKKSVEKLKYAGTTSAQLDAELILAHVLGVERTFLHANPQKKLSKTLVFHANNFLNKRVKRIPLAYIFREKDFFGRTFFVNENVLVPRPETETLIEITKKYTKKNDKILDIGTGSGIISVTLKAELSDEIEVFASDISLQALAVANLNAQKILNQNIDFFESNLLEQIPAETLSKITIITANLPYVNRDWVDFEKHNELHHEPQIALYARKNGLELIFKLLYQAQDLPNLRKIILEADPSQFEEIEKYANSCGFSKIISENYTIIFKK